MRSGAECGRRIPQCLATAQTATKQCTESRDEGYSECAEQRDQGYRHCCDWWPCDWACKAWTWVSHIVCVAWTWVKDIVCVAWSWFTATICVVWTVVTYPLCVVVPGVFRFLDGLASLVNAIARGIGSFVAGLIDGLLWGLLHPLQMIGTVVALFTGCPKSRSATIARTGNDGIQIIAHHGYSTLFPENTAQSCDFAVRKGADCIEIDLCFTADGQVVLWHDWNPDDVVSILRQLGKAPGLAYRPTAPRLGSQWRRAINTLTLSDFRNHYGYVNDEDPVDRAKHDIEYGPRSTAIPTLREFVDEFDSGVREIYLDIKMPDSDAGRAATMLDAVHDGLQRLGPDAGIVFMVPAFEVLNAMKDHAQRQGYPYGFTWDIEYPAGVVLNPLRYSAIDHAVTVHDSVASVGRPTSATFLPWATYRRTIGYDIERWNEVNADPATQNAGQPITNLVTWTLDDRDELECLVRMGVGGIITNTPETLAEILGR